MSTTERPSDLEQSSPSDGRRAHRFIFVGGSARSGTTLIQKMLCSHSKVCGGPEFDHAVPAMQLFSRMTSPQQLERQDFYYSEKEVTDIFREFYASLFDNLASRNPGVSYISEKTPANIAAAASLLKLFPDAFYVNVIRDGRDVVLSHQKVLQRFKDQHGQKGRKWWKEYSVREVSRVWNQNVQQYFDLKSNQASADRVLNVRYEDVVADPHGIMQPVLEKLGLSMENQLLNPESVEIDELGYGVDVDGVWYTDKMFNQSLNSLSVFRWRTDLPRHKRVLANFMQCRNLQRLGYEVSPQMLKLRNVIDRLRRRPVPSSE